MNLLYLLKVGGFNATCDSVSNKSGQREVPGESFRGSGSVNSVNGQPNIANPRGLKAQR